MTTVPQNPFGLSNRLNNSFQFDADEIGSAGLFVFNRKLPKTKELNVDIYLMHTRKSVRKLGTLLRDIKKEIRYDALDITADIVGTTSVPWLMITKKAVSLIGEIITKIPDRNFGFFKCF